jgi:DNA-binding transcriptional LysR family regulator
MTPAVELRHLRYFLAVAEELHFSRAAERMRIAQPALSQQIRKLETAIGVPLFHRTKRVVELTAAGQAMIRPARQALAEAAGAVEAAQRAARGETGHLRIGFIESAAMTLVPEAVRRFSAAHPDVGLSLNELAVDAQVEGLLSGRLDVAILRLPAPTDGLELASIAEEGLVVVLPNSHPLAGRSRISPATLAGEPLVLLARQTVPGLYDQIIALQHEHGAAVVAQEATSIQAVLGLVAAGLGVALLPASVRSLGRSGVSFSALSPSPRSEMQLAWRESDRSPLTAAFVDAARARAHG